MRSVAAIPATLCDKARRYPWHIGASPHRDGERPEFKLGYARLSEEGIRHGAHFFLPRLVCIPFSIIGLLAVFCLVKEVLDGRAALVAAAIWTTSPNILSNAATINPDLAATSAGAAVSYFIYLWWRNPTHEAAFCLALATGLALLTKHTWIVLFAAIPLVFAAKIVARRLSHGQKMSARRLLPGTGPSSASRNRGPTVFSRSGLSVRPSSARAWGGQLFLILCLAIVLLNCGYAFSGSFSPLREFRFQSCLLAGTDEPFSTGNRCRDTWLGYLPVPFPKDYVYGADYLKAEAEEKRFSFLAGEIKKGAWLHYYVSAIALKTPVLTLALLATGALLHTRRGPSRPGS